MKCLIKIPHRHLIYSFLFVAFLSFLSVFGFASDSYATSGSCSLTFTHSSSAYSSSVYTSSCIGSSDDFGFYFKPVSISYNLSTGSPSSVKLMHIYNRRATFFVLQGLNSATSIPSTDISSFTNYTLANTWKIINYPSITLSTISSASQLYTEFNSSVSGSVTIDFLYTNEFGSSPESTPCPPIPENPYDDKLDAIKNAIYACGASLFVIYFFVCIYKIIVKDGGSRK